MAQILSYTYEADDHCIACTRKRFDANGFDPAPSDCPHNPGDGRDENGIDCAILDYEGNYVHPRFTIDEWQEFDPEYLAEYPTQYLACGDCHEIIESYTHED